MKKNYTFAEHSLNNISIKMVTDGKTVNQKAKENYLKLLKERKYEYANQYGVTRIGIFGSVARDEQTDNSDVDICIEAPPMGLFMFSGLFLSLEELLGAPVDIVRMHKNINPRLKKRIEKDIIYV
jgi:predicted nucleotidyltransferase